MLSNRRSVDLLWKTDETSGRVRCTDELTALVQAALARSYLNCSTRKVVIISAPSGDTSSTREEEVAFVNW
jgi:hypothetical protein